MKIAALILTVLLTAPALAGAGGGGVTVTGLELRGAVSFATGHSFAGTEVGGLSSITYDRRRGVYYALSDDRSRRAPARFYSLEIDLADGRLDPGDVRFVGVTFLRGRDRRTLPPMAADPEGIFLVGRRRLFVSSEGDTRADPPIAPFVKRFKRSGREKRALPLPSRYLPDAAGGSGSRFNLAFESLTAPPGGGALYTATEAALVQDGPEADVDQPSPARILRFDLRRGRPAEEYLYVVEPVAEAPDPPDAFHVNGLVELLALDDRGTFLALERSFSVGRGNTVVLYEISLAGATDVSGEPTLFPDGAMIDAEPVSKRRLVSFAELGVVPDNLEGLALGPPMADGRRPLVVISDNNFNADQETQFIVLALELEER